MYTQHTLRQKVEKLADFDGPETRLVISTLDSEYKEAVTRGLAGGEYSKKALSLVNFKLTTVVSQFFILALSKE